MSAIFPFLFLGDGVGWGGAGGGNITKLIIASI